MLKKSLAKKPDSGVCLPFAYIRVVRAAAAAAAAFTVSKHWEDDDEIGKARKKERKKEEARLARLAAFLSHSFSLAISIIRNMYVYTYIPSNSYHAVIVRCKVILRLIEAVSVLYTHTCSHPQ